MLFKLNWENPKKVEFNSDQVLFLRYVKYLPKSYLLKDSNGHFFKKIAWPRKQ
jgi:hypothetical protein